MPKIQFKKSLLLCFKDGKEKLISLENVIFLSIKTNDRSMEIDLTKSELPKASAFHIDNLTINA